MVVVEVVDAVVSIFMPVSVTAGAGAMAADVSAAGVSSFFAHAASAKTAATRARRFMYFLLNRTTLTEKSPVRARVRDARFWRGGKVNLPRICVKGCSR